MKKLILAAAITLAAALPAHADYYVKDGNGVLKLMKAGTLAGSVVLPYNSLTDANGLPFGTASNPVAMRFGTGVFLPDFANPQHFICDSGCGGGGGGGSSYTVTYGNPIGTLGTPTGFKDASGNFQSLLGDTTNGQWVSVRQSVPLAVTGTFWQATQPVSIAGSLPVTGTFWPYTLGQQLASASVPVALPATQITALTPPTSVGITGTLPAFASTPAFTLTGTLPAYASTPTFNLGTLNGAATAALQSAVQGTVAGGTAAIASQLAGGIYNASPITLSNGQGSGLQVDSNGYLRVNVMVGGGGGGGGGTSSNFGSAFPTAGTAVGMSQGGNMVGLTGTSGNLNVQCANCSGSGVSTADQASFTAGASLFAGSGGVFNDGLAALTSGQQAMQRLTSARGVHMNLRNASGTELGVAAAPLQVSLANTAANGTALLVTGTGGTFPVTGTVAATQSGTWNIGSITTLPALPTGSNIIGRVGIDQTTPGTTNLVSIGTNGTVNPTTAANWGINTLGSTTSGQSGQLALGAVTTGAPSYTTAQSNALSLTTTGDLRTVISNTSFAVTQPTAANLNATVVGTGTFAVQAAATLAAETTKVIGTTRTLGNAGAIVDFAGQNASSPANAWLIGGQFNTSPTTITSGNSSPLQLDNAGNLKVNIVTGASSGAVAQGSTTSGQTGGLMQAAVTTSNPSYTTAQTNPLSLTTTGNLRVADSTAQGTLASILTAAQGANPVNVNTVVTAQTGLTPGVAQTGTIVAANIDLSSIVGTAIAVNSGNLSAGVQRNVLATNSPAIPTWGHGATGAAVPANAVYMGIISGGNLTGWSGAVTQGGAWTAVPAAATSSGATPYTLIAANTNNSTLISTGAHTVYSWQTGNINASTPYYLKFYDKATAPTCGSDTPVKVVLIPPANSGNNSGLAVGFNVTLGLGICIVTGIANSDNTAVPASTVIANVDYK